MLHRLQQAKKDIKSNDAVAIINYYDNGNTKEYTYGELHRASDILAAKLLRLATTEDLKEQRVAFLIDPPGYDYVRVQWAIWKAGGVAVPLAKSHPLPSLLYVLNDSCSSILVVSSSSSHKSLFSNSTSTNDAAKESSLLLIALDEEEGEEETEMENSTYLLPDIHPGRRAMILYTSGTTSLPKGVVTTHANLEAQISTLVQSWCWSSHDRTLCVLPLHHIHGIVNVVCCALWVGATCTFLPSFSAEKVFHQFQMGNINVFMAVPTIYHKLISYFEKQCSVEEQRVITQSLRSFRLMVCGSAALPVSVMDKWESISGGHKLLERYGMTEVGMAISNPYHGLRKPGSVGVPLPGVDVRIIDEEGNVAQVGSSGEILIRGNNVFLEYWNRPKETAEAFTSDGWFKTGDVAVIEEDGYYRIMGRKSVDIIKSGGYKISALEIEEVLRTYPSISDVAVVGIPDEEWGELITAALVLVNNNDHFNQDHLTTWLRERIPSYKLPRKYQIMQELPRNSMGKVVKSDVKNSFTTKIL